MSRAEKKVASYLEGNGIDTFLPLLPVRSQWKDRIKVVRLPLFRGYLFARFAPDRLGTVLKIPGIATVIRHSGVPAPIPDEQIANVRRFAAGLESADVGAEPVHRFVEGQRVRILASPFDGAVTGVIVAPQDRGQVDVFVGLRLIGQFVRIRVRGEDLAPVADG